MELDQYQLAAYAISVMRRSDYSLTAGEPSIAITVSVGRSLFLVCYCISATTLPNFTNLLWLQCNVLCTSGFVDDVMFSRNKPNIDICR